VFAVTAGTPSRARALQIKATRSPHIHLETGPHDPHIVFGVSFLEIGERARLSAGEGCVRDGFLIIIIIIIINHGR